MLKVNEIFYSIQGESSYAGLPCVFIRLTFCNLRCTYCDTEYAFYEGKDMTIEEILTEIKKYDCKLLEVTGGEPLTQNESFDLLKRLCNEQYEVLLETSGSISIQDVDKRVKIIMDLKTPSSGMMNKNLYENVTLLKPSDEIKFVLSNREDYDWAKEIISQHNLNDKCTVLMGCVFNKLKPIELVKWILEDKLNVRFQIQLHKYIWEPTRRGV
ncbi:MAG: 7-carboxy-7-deazaguanine synthase QueE [Ignavibacteria bacterium]|nr:7-carboxy-7-deazaguanine synthase QueE [Ignavibacteria bacterium]